MGRESNTGGNGRQSGHPLRCDHLCCPWTNCLTCIWGHTKSSSPATQPSDLGCICDWQIHPARKIVQLTHRTVRNQIFVSSYILGWLLVHQKLQSYKVVKKSKGFEMSKAFGTVFNTKCSINMLEYIALHYINDPPTYHFHSKWPINVFQYVTLYSKWSIREYVSQLSVTVTNTWAKSTYEEKRFVLTQFCRF